VTAFYDIDTPVTLANLAAGKFEYVSPHLIPRYDLYLSFTGGPTLQRIEQQYRSPSARALYCSFDPEIYYVDARKIRWDAGYLGTWSEDRQSTLDRLLLDPARAWPEGRFIVAGAQYPDTLRWPHNVKHVTHLAPRQHRAFYNAQRFTLNVTRAEMIRAGWSPSVRLFEAAACGVPIISDWWDGLDAFFEPDREILIAETATDVLRYLRHLPDRDRRAIAHRARARVLEEHTAAHRARELESYVADVIASRSARSTRVAK
jgi:spore maturation protein CgeB